MINRCSSGTLRLLSSLRPLQRTVPAPLSQPGGESVPTVPAAWSLPGN